MAYQVSLTARAKADAYDAFERIRDISPSGAERWLQGLFTAVLSLGDMPARCPLIPEAEELSHPARHLLYGKHSAIYRSAGDLETEH